VKTVFVDTHYWVAMINPRDQWHGHARAASSAMIGLKLITTDAVLTEVLNYFSGEGELLRNAGIRNVQAILANRQVEVIFTDRGDFFAGFQLYEARPDKGYSLTDCISMNVMRERGIAEVLSNDIHFTQEGFRSLLRIS
jgi:predicted nucleic acid-binding protein